MVLIRTAETADALSLALLAEKTFRDSFASFNTEEDMRLHCSQSYDAGIQAREISSPTMVSLLAELQGEVVGFAQLRLEKAPPFVPGENPGEILRLYVDSPWHGKGVAQNLMNASLDELQRKRCDGTWLGVWENNPRAIAFYKKYGFEEVGEHIFSVGTDPQRDIVLYKTFGN